MEPLYPYQADARQKIAAADKPIVNAFEPGLGKSRVVLEIMRARGYRRILIVCPASAVLVWTREIKRWWGSAALSSVTVLHPGKAARGKGIFILSYGLLSTKGAGAWLQKVMIEPFAATVLDEAHYLKNPRANRSLRLFGFLERKCLGWVHAMTGTPAPNHAGELWPLLHYLRPELLKLNGHSMSESEFMGRYTRVRHFKVRHHWVEQVTGSKNLPELRQRIAPMFIIARKKDVLPDLPPLDFVVLPVVARGWGGMIGDQADLDDDAFLASMARLPASILQQIGLAKVDSVVDWISDLLDNDPKRRLCMWALHHAVIDAYAVQLTQYGVAKLDGRDNLAARTAAVDRFMSGQARIFLGQIMAGGMALTLVSKAMPCSDVVFAEASFSPANNFQAACRVHRIGQHDGVLVRHAAAAGTIDDRVQEILARKSREIAELFG